MMKLLKIVFYSIVLFCVVSYATVIISLSHSIGRLDLKPVVNIGFPYRYYYQFWLSDADSPNCGWDFERLVWDGLISLALTITIFIWYYKRKNN